MDPRHAVGAVELVVDGGDHFGKVLVAPGVLGRAGGAGGVSDGLGNLQQHTRLGDVAPVRLSRLDERVHVHRISLILLCQAAARSSPLGCLTGATVAVCSCLRSHRTITPTADLDDLGLELSRDARRGRRCFPMPGMMNTLSRARSPQILDVRQTGQAYGDVGGVCTAG